MEFIVVIFMLIFLLLNFFSLPGNWLMVLLLGAIDFFSVRFSPGSLWWISIIALALLGEILEWVGQYLGGKKYGLSSQGNFSAFIFAIVGSILGAPFLLGIGAIIGGLLGAYLGSFVVEKIRGKESHLAHKAAMGAVFGKIMGLFAKLGAGVGIIFMVVSYF